MSVRHGLALLLLASLSPLAVGQKDAGKRYALVVGVNEYAVKQLAALKFAENDAEGLAETLDNYNVVVMTKSRGKTKRELEPTAQNIRAQLKELFAKKTRHDTILLALAGHGVQLEVADPEGKSTNKTFPMFCPSDAQLNDTDYKSGKSPTLLNLDDLLDAVGSCGAGTKMILIDACRNEVKARNVSTSSVKIPKGVAVLFSCSEGQRAFETPKLGKGHGVFFHHVIETLKNGDSISWTDLSKRVIDKVEEDVDKLIGDGAKQEPHEVRSGGRAPIVVERSGEGERLFRQGMDFYLGTKGEINDAKSFKLFQQAAGKRHPVAAGWVGRMVYLGLGTDADQTRGLQLIESALPAVRKQADRSPEAMFLMGGFYARGLGVEKDAKEAVRWFHLAAEGGEVSAMTNLAFMYENGRGVDANEQEALKWYKTAAEKGEYVAMNIMGTKYRTGKGVTQDEKQAQIWYKKAADKGYAEAMYHLGELAETAGSDREKAQTEALGWYRRAAALGHVDAKNALPRLEQGRDADRLYRQGMDAFLGIKTVMDHPKALKLLRQSADKGNALAAGWAGRLVYTGPGSFAEREEGRKQIELALPAVRKLANRDPEAMLLVGLCHTDGIGVEKDEKQAVAWFQKAANMGEPCSTNWLGAMYFGGRGVTKNEQEAVKWYKVAAGQGEPYAMSNLAWLYENGRVVSKNEKEALSLYEKAAEKGNPIAMNTLGVKYQHGQGVGKDEKKAVLWYRKGAEADYAIAMTNLGWMYANARGVAQNDKEAVLWYQKAAAKGEPYGMTNLAMMYANGRGGLAKDEKEALFWYKKAADLNEPFAMNTLGVLHRDGTSVKQDDKEAVAWFRKSAALNNVNAMANLGWMYEAGRGVDKDEKEAVRWYRQVADSGDAYAMSNLGFMYENGRGIEKDLAKALEWYKKSANLGDARGKEGVARLTGKK